MGLPNAEKTAERLTKGHAKSTLLRTAGCEALSHVMAGHRCGYVRVEFRAP